MFEKSNVWNEKPDSRRDPDAAAGAQLPDTDRGGLTSLINTEAATNEGGVTEPLLLTSDPCIYSSAQAQAVT